MEEQVEVPAPSDDAEKLEEEFEDIARLTRNDGTVEAEILDVKEVRSKLHVEFRLPSGDVETHEMVKPERETDEYEFVRLCRKQGASIHTFTDLLIGSYVRVEKTDGGDWRICTEPKQSIVRNGVERFRGLFQTEAAATGQMSLEDIALMTLLSPLSFAVMLVTITEDGFNGVDPKYLNFLTGAAVTVLFLLVTAAL